MKLRDWRTQQGLTLRQLAERLDIGEGANPSRRMNRIETGEAQADALLADRIVVLTGGSVTVFDLHETRRNWLRAPPAPVEAAS